MKTADGRIVEDSVTHGGAVTVALADLRPCLREAVLRMRAGGVSRFVCPLPKHFDDSRPEPPAAILLAIETTLVAVGEPLPPPGPLSTINSLSVRVLGCRLLGGRQPTG